MIVDTNGNITIIGSTSDSSACNTYIYMIKTDSSGLITRNYFPEKISTTVFPNPTTDIITITFESFYQSIEMTLFNSFGIEVLRTSQFSGNQKELYLSELDEGVYFLSIICGSTTSTIKLLKF